jgi:ATP-dependent helicase HrpB
VNTLRAGNRLVLVAPTGSGKTTQVPQMLLDAGLAGEKKIVVLQPRRVAARTVAARVAWERGGPLGGEVGYQIRFDDQTGLGTRICFVTEGILLRWLQDDRTLGEVGAILFDEFHERNLLSDVALALVKRLQRTERPDLKLVVMSATLDAEPVAKYLSAECGMRSAESSDRSEPACPILISEGQSYPVQVCYQTQHDERSVMDQSADVVEDIINSGEVGDILVFMPGMAEINATIGALRAMHVQERLALIPLHGDLPPEQQDLAFQPNGARKVVVATNVAETSVTIDGIRHVVDSGLARVSRYDAERGIGTLLMEPISRASADQRRGRAGRTAPGTCHRLWTESGHLNRAERNTPEIQRCDLAEVVLLLHSLGIRRATEFDWLDKPEPQAVQRAEELLVTLGAIKRISEDTVSANDVAGAAERASSPRPSPPGEERETEGSVGRNSGLESPGRGDVPIPHSGLRTPHSDLTAIGRRMLRLPMHPRYSRMLVEAERFGCVPAAALCAALVSGRDLMMRVGRDDKHIKEARELFEASQESDFYTLMRAYQFAKNNRFSVEACRRYGVHAQTARQVEQTYDQILRLAGVRREGLEGEASDGAGKSAEPGKASSAPASGDPLPRCLMTGFIDQLCVRRDLGTLECELTEGRHGTLMRESVVQTAPLLVVASIREVAGRGSENLTLLGLATAVKREWVMETFPEQLSALVEHLYDRTHKRVAAVRLVRFRDLVIHHEHQKELEPLASGRCLAEAQRKGLFELPLFNHELKQLIARANLVAAAMPELEFPEFNAPAITDCLARAFAGLTLAKEAQAAALKESLVAHLGRERLAWLDEMTPLSITWHDGRKLKLLYAESARDEDGEPNSPELQVKLHECFGLKEHPHLCEGKLPIKLWLTAPDGKRLESTFNWPAFKTNTYPRLRPTLQKKYPGMAWL